MTKLLGLWLVEFLAMMVLYFAWMRSKVTFTRWLLVSCVVSSSAIGILLIRLLVLASVTRLNRSPLKRMSVRWLA